MEKEKLSRSLLEILVYRWLKGCLVEFKREIGPVCKENGFDLKEAAPLLLELLTASLELIKKEVQREIEKNEKKA